MPTKAVQQFMLGTVLSNENEARQTLAAMKAAGYDGIELRSEERRVGKECRSRWSPYH